MRILQEDLGNLKMIHNQQNTLSIELKVLAETAELECKLAAGRDGRGELPKDFWKTYSAFANTRGGVVLLGIKEKPKGTFRVAGIQEPEQLITDLFNQLNNPQKVNVNLLSDRDVEQIATENGTVIKIALPPASRTDKPVHLGSNPLTDSGMHSVDNENYSVDSDKNKKILEVDAYDSKGRLLSSALEAPAIHDLQQLQPDFLQKLLGLAQPARDRKRLNPMIMQQLILKLCSEQFITRSCLAELLERTPDALRNQYLNKLIESKLLTLAFPQTPNDKRQAYITTEKGLEKLKKWAERS